MNTTFQLPKKILIIDDACADIDYYYGPWSDLSEACEKVPIQIRKAGRTVGVYVNNEVTEYWWNKDDSLEDDDLIEKSSLYLTISGGGEKDLQEGDEQVISFNLSGKFPTQGARLERSIDGVSYSVVDSKLPVQSGINIIPIHETQPGTTAYYRISVIDVYGNLANGPDGGKYVYWTIRYGKVDIKLNIQSLQNQIITQNSHDFDFQYSVIVVDKELPYDIKIDIENDDDADSYYVKDGVTLKFPYVLHNVVGDKIETVTIKTFPYNSSIQSHSNSSIVRVTVDYEDQTFSNNDKDGEFLVIDIDAVDIEILNATHNKETNTWTLLNTFNQYQIVTIPIHIIAGNSYTSFRVYTIIDGVEKTTFIAGNSTGNLQLSTFGNGTYTINILAQGLNLKSTNVQFTVELILNYDNVSKPGKEELMFSDKNASSFEENVWTDKNNKKLYFSFASGETGLDKNYIHVSGPGCAKINSGTYQFGGGFSLELYYKANHIGNLYKVCQFSLGDSNVDIYDDKIEMYGSGYQWLTEVGMSNRVELLIPNNEWTHVVIIGGQTSDENAQKEEDKFTRSFSGIYINGVLCAALPANVQQDVIISGTYNLGINVDLLDNLQHGDICLNTLRLYSTALTSSEVLQNYKSCIPVEEALYIEQKENLNTPKIVFTNIKDTLPIEPVDNDKYIGNYKLINFEGVDGLNNQTEKKLLKTTAVACEVKFSNFDSDADVSNSYALVTTQGTSTLLFPVKNYKAVFYDANTFENKKAMKFDAGWLKAESKITFKADYMDSSHLNNTPTCMWYNHVLDVITNDQNINFEKSPSKDKNLYDAIKGIPCLIYYNDGNGEKYVGTFMLNIDKSGKNLGFDIKDNQDNKIPCLSFEGKSNTANDAGAFFDTGITVNDDGTYLLSSLYNKLSEFFETRYSYDNNEDLYYELSGQRSAYENDLLPWGQSYPHDTNDKLLRFHWGTVIYKNDDHKTIDLDDNAGQGFVRMWAWVARSQYLSKEDYKTEFAKLFSVDYCILYYINMILFGQVDNPGKNCMWDTWDGRKWYPRPYDLDSELGLDNTGIENIPVFAELNESTSLDDDHYNIDGRRYCYNTGTSRLWTLFSTNFSDEIEAKYKLLRKYSNNDVTLYKPETIFDFFKNIVIDTIGEKYYNIDFIKKYLSVTSEVGRMMQVCHGNRWGKFRKWLSERFVFCDTLFLKSGSTSPYISIRPSGNHSNHDLVFDTRSPQYVTLYRDNIKIQTVLCANNDTITSNFDNNQVFTILTRPDNIAQITGINTINPSVFSIVSSGGIENEYKFSNLLKIDYSGVNQITSVPTNDSEVLQEINISNSSILSVYVPNTVRKLIATNANSLTSVIFESGSIIEEIEITKSSLTDSNVFSELKFEDMPFLRSVTLLNIYVQNSSSQDTEQAVKFKNLPNMVNAPTITNCQFNCSVAFDNVGFTNLTLDGLIFNNNIVFNNIQSLSKLSLRNANIIQNVLDISSLTNLQELDLYSTKVNKLITAENNGIKKLTLLSSTITDIDPGSLENGLHSVNMINFNNLQGSTYTDPDTGVISNTNSIFRNCLNITKVENLNYTGRCDAMFFGDSNLEYLSGNISVSNGTSMFYNCNKLSSISGVSINKNCTTVSDMFYQCYLISYSTVRSIIHTSVTNNNGSSNILTMTRLCYGLDGTSDDSDTLNLDWFFSGIDKVTTLDYCFASYYRTDNKIKNITGKLPASTIEANCMFRRLRLLQSIQTDILQDAKTNLISAESMFAGCDKLTTQLTNQFFNGCTKLEDISYMFADTCVEYTFSHNDVIFSGITNLKKADGIFERTLGDIVSKISGEVSGVFKDNQYLISCAQCFKGTKISITLSGPLFYNGSQTIDISQMFYGEDINLIIYKDTFPATINYNSLKKKRSGIDKSVNYSGGIFLKCRFTFSSEDLPLTLSTFISRFSNCLSLDNMFRDSNFIVSGNNSFVFDLSNFNSNTFINTFANIHLKDNGDTEYSFTVSLTLPDGVTDTSSMFANTKITGINLNFAENKQSLNNTQKMFMSCLLLNVNIAGTNPLTFNGCSSLQNTQSMFENSAVQGTIPYDLFRSCKNTIENTSRMFAKSNITGIQDGYVDSNNDNLVVGGLFSDCTGLKKTDCMFAKCNQLVGKIPKYMFYLSESGIYPYFESAAGMFAETSFNDVYSEVESDITTNYFIPKELFDRTTNLKNISWIFSVITHNLTDLSISLNADTFKNLNSLTNVSHLFDSSALFNSDIPNVFSSCANTINDASYSFYYAGKYSKSSISGHSLNIDLNIFSRNGSSSLLKVECAFVKFCDLSTNSSTNLPKFNDTGIFKNIHKNVNLNAKSCFNSTNVLAPYDAQPWTTSDAHTAKVSVDINSILNISSYDIYTAIN